MVHCNDLRFKTLPASPRIEWDVDAAEKGGYEHFMLKEMYEQPKAITDTVAPRIKEEQIVIEELGMSD